MDMRWHHIQFRKYHIQITYDDDGVIFRHFTCYASNHHLSLIISYFNISFVHLLFAAILYIHNRHSFGEQFSLKKWAREIAGQREILSAYGGVKQSDIRGMRAPFLSIGGNKMFKMLHDFNFTYDSSMPVYENRPPSWPYTLDYKLFHGE
jgi:hypothetical protein